MQLPCADCLNVTIAARGAANAKRHRQLGMPLGDEIFWIVIGTIRFGHVARIGCAFILRFEMHIHVWKGFDT